MAQRKNSGRTQQRAGRDNRNDSATKAGPGRFHRGGKSGNKLAKPRAMRAADALVAAWAQRRVTNWKGARDDAGAYTLVGRNAMPNGITDGRRRWLAGISAQRGY
jgi:hypothetical protein